MDHATSHPDTTGRSASAPAPVRVLVVDDDPEMRRYLQLGIERGWRRRSVVTVCPDGAAALEALRRERFDIAVCDVRLPGMDGLALCDAIERDARHATTPVLLVTGDPDAVERAGTLTRKHARRALLTKPFNSSRLAEALTRLMEAR